MAFPVLLNGNSCWPGLSHTLGVFAGLDQTHVNVSVLAMVRDQCCALVLFSIVL